MITNLTQPTKVVRYSVGFEQTNVWTDSAFLLFNHTPPEQPMKTKLAGSVAAIMMMITTSCAPTGPDKDHAAIKVVSKVGSYTATVQEIDGWPVPPKKTLVLLPQGNHKIVFGLERNMCYGSSGNDKVIVATTPVETKGDFTAGKMHQINPSHVTLSRVATGGTSLFNITTGTKDIYEAFGPAEIVAVRE